MWKRRELKKLGKKQFFRNWWASVAVCFILAFTGAEFAQSVSFIQEIDPSFIPGSEPVVAETTYLSNWDIMLKWLDIDPTDGNHPVWAAADQSIKPYFEMFTQPFSAFFAFLDRSDFQGPLGITLAVVGVVGGVWFSLFVVGVLMVGGRRFFLESRVRDHISISAIFAPFKRGTWLNVFRVRLVNTIYLLLWAFTVVGFPVKLLAYSMVPYILAENPNARAGEAITLSRQMMKGHKWRAFWISATLYLQWTLLPMLLFQFIALIPGMLTGAFELYAFAASAALGLLSIFFVNGYTTATFTQLYVVLRREQIDKGAELSRLFIVPEFGGEMPSGPKPKLGQQIISDREDEIFHFAEKLKLDYGRKYSIPTLVLLFFSFAFVGWVWEVALHIVQAGVFVNRGTLFGPWLPIYGTGGVAVLILLKKCFKSPPLTFVASMVICSAIEYFSSWQLEMTKGVRYWDYSNYFMNLNGRICLEGAIIFGLGCCAVVYLAAPLLAAQFDKISPRKQMAVGAVLLVLFGADNVWSHFHPNVGEGITEGTAPAVQTALAERPEQRSDL